MSYPKMKPCLRCRSAESSTTNWSAASARSSRRYVRASRTRSSGTQPPACIRAGSCTGTCCRRRPRHDSPFPRHHHRGQRHSPGALSLRHRSDADAAPCRHAVKAPAVRLRGLRAHRRQCRLGRACRSMLERRDRGGQEGGVTDRRDPEPPRCSYCDKRCRDQSELIEHQRSHDGDPCWKCGVRHGHAPTCVFATKDDLERKAA